jgi:hypothetical protein
VRATHRWIVVRAWIFRARPRARPLLSSLSAWHRSSSLPVPCLGERPSHCSGHARPPACPIEDARGGRGAQRARKREPSHRWLWPSSFAPVCLPKRAQHSPAQPRHSPAGLAGLPQREDRPPHSTAHSTERCGRADEEHTQQRQWHRPHLPSQVLPPRRTPLPLLPPQQPRARTHSHCRCPREGHIRWPPWPIPQPHAMRVSALLPRRVPPLLPVPVRAVRSWAQAAHRGVHSAATLPHAAVCQACCAADP